MATWSKAEQASAASVEKAGLAIPEVSTPWLALPELPMPLSVNYRSRLEKSSGK
jgi:hypothetical protein